MYKTKNSGSKTYNLNSNWHSDAADAYSSLKVLIYLCDVDENNGPLSIKDPVNGQEVQVIGNAGTTVFFNARDVLHSAGNTISKNRYTLSFLLMPNISKPEAYIEKPINVLRKKNPFFN